MISIICVYNNDKILNECLKESLKLQKQIEYETIFVDSRKYKFHSAAEALNYAGNLANGEYLIFLHQDIVLVDNTLSEIYDYCKNNQFGIMGVAGAKYDYGEIVDYSKIVHGLKKKNASTNDDFRGPLQVDTLEECLLVIPREVFHRYKFTEYYNTWHLYGTEYCLKMKNVNQKILVVPVYLWHKSSGASLNLNYFDAIKALAKEYKNKTKIIVTLFGGWPTNCILINLKCFYRKIRFKVKGI